jgi:glutamyl-Q tRNA(Asp) synthetase
VERGAQTRFAPAPTGYLHLGHALNAMFVWGLAARFGARVVLRIEDHDRQRCRPEYEAAILEDLEWLGFRADAADGPLRQSERTAIYEDALARLRGAGLVYACECSRAAIAARTAGAATEGERPYPGTCANKRLAERPGRGLRVRLPPIPVRFVDLRHGPEEQHPWEQCGDVLAKDRDGNWTYQFAATVDDLVQRMGLVVRGDDLRPSTGRQILLARLLGRPDPPAFYHHPLIMKSPSQKLSKAGGDTGIRELRRQGWTPARVLGEAAWRAGVAPSREGIDPALVSSII